MVLLILAGITIGTLTSDNGVIKEANLAKEQAERVALEEQIEEAILIVEQKKRNPTLDDVIAEIVKIDTVDRVDRVTGDIYYNKLEDPIKGKLDDYLGKTSTGDGDNNGGGDTTTPTKTEVGELTAGEYVNYIDANGTTRKCIVLYDATSSYGIQIITAERVEEVVVVGTTNGEISNSATDLSKAMSAYNVAITTLDTKAKAYLNTTYATSARCVGSVPNSPTTEATSMFNTSYSYMSTYSGKLKNSDTNYEKDWEQIKKLELTKKLCSNGIVIMASRFISSDSTSTIFSLARPVSSGIISSVGGFALRSNGVKEVWPGNGGLYPVMTLKTTLKITGGAGTDESPYILEI